MKTIIATNNLKKLIEIEIQKQGFEANLNYIDVSNVQDISYMFDGSKFNGNIGRWPMPKRNHETEQICQMIERGILLNQSEIKEQSNSVRRAL